MTKCRAHMHAHSHMQKGLETAANMTQKQEKKKKEDYVPFPVRLYLNQHKLLRGECCLCSSLGRGTTKPERHLQTCSFPKCTTSGPLFQQTELLSAICTYQFLHRMYTDAALS